MREKTAAMYGLFEEPHAAQRAYAGLKRAGVADGDITVISAEPFEAFEFAHRDHSLVLFRLAALGGIIGLITGVSMTVGMERAWPMDVGGMPTVAWWPNLVVIFELTMLGAILTTVVSLLVTAGLPGGKGAMYDPEVSDGKILVGVPLTAGRTADTVRQTLDASGALVVKTADF